MRYALRYLLSCDVSWISVTRTGDSEPLVANCDRSEDSVYPVQALDDGVVKQPIRRNRIPAVRPVDTR